MDHPLKNRAIITISVIAIVLSIIVVAGWILKIPGLQTVLPAFEAMKVNTAICFLLLGSALLITQYDTPKYAFFFYGSLSLLTFIAVVTIAQDLFHFNAGLDQLFVKDDGPIYTTYPFPGRMSVTSAVCFLLMGIGLLAVTARRTVLHMIAQYLFHVVTVLSSAALIGYLYRASFFYGLSSVGPMAVQSVAMFFFISIGASLLHPSLGVTNLFTGKLVGNKMARRLFVLIIFVVITLGTLRIQTQHYYRFSVELWVALVTVCFLLICLFVIWNTATWLNGIDLKRYEAEGEIRVMNEELEEIVEQRTMEVQKSEEKYRLLIEHASDAIYIVDFKGNFTDVNDSMCRMTGYTREELLQINVEDIVDPEQLKTDPIKHGARDSIEVTVRERRLLRKDRSVFDAEISVKLFADDKVLIMARDITARKKMEAELKDAEVKFRTIADKSMVGVYISQGQRFTYVNPRFAEIFGYEPRDLINTEHSAIEIIISEDHREMVREYVQARYNGERDNAHYEAKGKKKDGTTNWVEFYGNRVVIGGISSIIGTMLDITERKLADEVILREKTLSETIINSLPEVFYLRNENGDFLRWNKNFEKLTGYTPKEIRESNAKLMIAEEDRGVVRMAVERLKDEEQATVEAKVISKSGQKIPFLITITSIEYESQPCVLGIAIDITERLKAEEELRSSELKYKLLFDSNPVPLWMIAKDDLSIIAVNAAAAALYGYTQDELLHASVTIVRLKEDLEQQQQRFRAELSDSTELSVARHVKKDGTIMYVQIIAHDIIFEGRPVRLSLTNDITEKLNAEESLQKSEANLQTILNITDMAYGLFDLDLKLIACNQEAVKFCIEQYNHSPEKGDRIADFFPHERFPQFKQFADEVLKGNSVQYEIDYPQPDGTLFWFDVKLFPIINDNKEILGLMMSLFDITERKNTENDLKNAYSRIQSQINSIKGMAWKQSHLMRSPLANLKALADLLKDHPADTESLAHFQTELDRLDAIIHEMAQDASDHVL